MAEISFTGLRAGRTYRFMHPYTHPDMIIGSPCLAGPQRRPAAANHRRLAVLLPVLIAVLSFSSQSGCSAPQDRSESDADSLIALVLADLHEAETIQKLGISQDSLRRNTEILPRLIFEGRDSVLAHHGFSHEAFMEAVEPYLDDPDRYVALYDRVLDVLFQRGEAFEGQGE